MTSVIFVHTRICVCGGQSQLLLLWPMFILFLETVALTGLELIKEPRLVGE